MLMVEKESDICLCWLTLVILFNLLMFKGALEAVDLEGIKWCGFFVAVCVILLIIVLYYRSLYDERKVAILQYDVDSMGGRQFEDFLANVFREIGYYVKKTPYSRDQGADLIIENVHGRFVVQAKRANKNVGNKAVQEVTAAIRYYGADSGMVVTNSGFTKSAIALARANGIDLIDGTRLNNMIYKVHLRNDPEKEGLKINATNRSILLYQIGFLVSVIIFVIVTGLINSEVGVIKSDVSLGGGIVIIAILFLGVGSIISAIICGLLYLDKRIFG